MFYVRQDLLDMHIVLFIIYTIMINCVLFIVYVLWSLNISTLVFWNNYLPASQEAGLPIKSCEIIMDRTVAGPARNRWNASSLANCVYRTSLAFADTSSWSRRRRRWRIRSRSTRRLSSRSFGFCQSKITRAKTFKCKIVSLIHFRNLDQQLFNKANEIQEEISRKR